MNLARRIWEDAIAPEDRVFLERMAVEEDRPRERWGARPALLIIDMSYGFVTDEYPHGFARTGVPCAQNIARLLAAGRAAGIPIIWTTGQARGPRVAEAGRWKHSKKAHSVTLKDDRFYEIVAELRPNPEAACEHVLIKSKPSGFWGTEMDGLLTYYNCDTVIVTGMVTSGCVRATAVDAFSHNFITIVPEECVADRVQTSHKVTLFDLNMKYADVVGMAEVLGYLAELDRTVGVEAERR